MKVPRASPSVSHVALLTPYDGGNLGDAAIQEALISNFRRFHSPLQISGITLDPERTAALHSIPCYLLAINSRPHYKVKTRPAAESTDHAKTNLPDETGSEVNFFSRLRRTARSSAFLKPIRALFRLAKEGRHVLQSYLLLREVDLLVVAGGGQLDEEWGGIWGHPYALMKWSVLARLAGAKTVFLSVGSCRIESRVSRKFVQVALSLALYRSYRDEGTRQIALEISPAADGPVGPDLAFSLPSTHNEPLSGTLRPLHVGVSPIAFSRPGLWPTERAAAFERYMTELGAFVAWLLSRGASVTLFSSSTPDEQTFKDLRDRVSPHIEKAAFARLSSRDVSTVRELVGLLQSMDFVVASRLHGLLLSFLAAKPSLAISYDRKVQRLMEDLDQARYCFDIRSFTCRELLEAFLDLQAKADFIPQTLADIRQRYDMLLENQYRLVAEYLSPGSYGLHPLRSAAASPATARRSDSDVREIR